MYAKSLLLALVATPFVAAHTNFRGFYVSGQSKPTSDYGYCVRPVADNNPITNYSSAQMVCNTVTGSAAGVCTAAPGQEVTMVWHEHSMTETYAVGGDHDGPIQAYMAKVSDAATASPSGLKWFKVYSEGLITANPQVWATDRANDNKGLITFKLPCDLAPGDYLLRSELIALHVASSANGAQLYAGCAQLRITGSGSGNPSTISLPGYSASDPGLLFNKNANPTSYTPPGPAVYSPSSCSGGGNPGGNTTTRTTTQQQQTTTRTTTRTTTQQQQTTTRPITTTTASGGGANCAGKYAQCGGSGFSGPTCCQSGSTCTFSNNWYSQCL